MFRKFIEKINNFIQWTKKWHFCHVLFVGTFLLVVPYIFLFLKNLISEIIILIQMPNCIFESFDYIPFWIFYFVGTLIVIAFLALIIQVFTIIKRAFARKSIFVQSSFLLHNQYYNRFYTISFIYFWIGIVTWQLALFFNYITSLNYKLMPIF